jgi:hypothetical protein
LCPKAELLMAGEREHHLAMRFRTTVWLTIRQFDE